MILKVACFTDTHGKAPKHDGYGYDGILHGGDVYNHISQELTGTGGTTYSEKPGHKNDMKGLEAWRNNLKAPLFVVRGNHDVADPAKVFADEITGSVRELKPGVFVVGIGWHGEKFYDLPCERDLGRVVADACRQAVLKIPNRAQTILLTHYPAATREITGMGNPEGWIFDCVRLMMENVRPMFCIAGHIHEMFGKGYTHKASGVPILFPGPKGLAVRVEDDGEIKAGALE